MRAILQVAVLFALLLGGCASPQHALAPSPVPAKQVTTEADAIGVVLADFQRRGGDPQREECSATRSDEGWHVTAWHMWYPHRKGSSRFVPGGFTIYVVSTDGGILSVMPGS